MIYDELPTDELVQKRKQLTEGIRILWKQHANLKRERDKIDRAIEKHQLGELRQTAETQR